MYKTFTFVIVRTPQLFFAHVYKTVSLKAKFVVKKLFTKNAVQKWLIHLLNDPIGKILAKNCNLTKTQLETLLIDFLAPNIAGKSLKLEEKARLRLSKAGLSRGAFNRTLRQARKNVVQSIYTIILLGYLGVFEDTRLDPYLEVANKLQEYVRAYKGTLMNRDLVGEHAKIVDMLHEELKISLERLSNPRAMTEM